VLNKLRKENAGEAIDAYVKSNFNAECIPCEAQDSTIDEFISVLARQVSILKEMWTKIFFFAL